MKFLVSFDIDPFYGEITPIENKQKLYEKIYDRTYLLGCLEDSNGTLRAEEDVSEDELLDIFKRVTYAANIHFVGSIDELRAISDNAEYQKRLVDPFVAHHLATSL